MPQLLFTDGTQEDVGYELASNIYAILNGTAANPSDVHEELATKVSDVVFEKQATVYQNRRHIDHDPEMAAILKNTALTGREKFYAVGRRLRQRLS